MEKYGVQEARDKFSALVDLAAKGEDVTITRNGKAVAKLVQADARGDDQRALDAVSEARKIRESLPTDLLEGTSIKSLVEEGRR